MTNRENQSKNSSYVLTTPLVTRRRPYETQNLVLEIPLAVPSHTSVIPCNPRPQPVMGLHRSRDQIIKRRSKIDLGSALNLRCINIGLSPSSHADFRKDFRAHAFAVELRTDQLIRIIILIGSQEIETACRKPKQI
jgi:hypothetical protein